jgi:fructuronate reductase
MPASKTFARLSARSLGHADMTVTLPAYDRTKLETGILHFGPGAFHRAHQAYFIDKIAARDPRWGLTAVALRGTSITDALTAQDGLYTIAELSETPRLRVIGAVREAIAARITPQAVLARLAAPRLAVVTMTVTENGYCLTRDGDLDTARDEIAHDLAGPAVPQSLIGWLVEGLARRRRAGLKPTTMISCDNVADNGARLKCAVLQFARERDADLARWIEGEAHFPATMVDSITPASDEALKARVALHLGAVDMAPVQREPFVQWVMEDVPRALGPDWASAGVTVTHDVMGYEQAKLRILNGAHSTLAYLGLLRGRKTTQGAMADAVLARFVRLLVTEDILPSLTPPQDLDLPDYVETVFARIANPAITHHLGQIAWDGSQKLPYRLFGVIADALKHGRPLDRLAVPVAAWMRFVRARLREGAELIDPLAPRLAEIVARCTGTGANDVMIFLALESVFPRDIAQMPEFTRSLAQAYDAIGDRGMLPGDGW